MSDLTNSMKASTMSVSSGKSKVKHNTSTTENTMDKLGLNNPPFGIAVVSSRCSLLLHFMTASCYLRSLTPVLAGQFRCLVHTGSYCCFSLFLLVLAWLQGEQAR